MSPKYLITDTVGMQTNEIKILKMQLAESKEHNATLQNSIITLEKQNDRLYHDRNAFFMLMIILIGIIFIMGAWIIKGAS